jgi:integrase
MNRRRFGKVRKLPSRRWQASYLGPDGRRRNGPDTFRTKSEAEQWLAAAETDLRRGSWVDDGLARVRFEDYARGWLRDHPRLGPRWRETCERNLRLHLAPLAGVALRDITHTVVREWHATALRGSGGRTSIVQSYRFLRAVMNNAVREGALPRHPCDIPGAGSDRAKERPVATPEQIAALTAAIAPRYRAAVVLAAWGGLRRGELLALHHSDVNLEAGTVTVRRTRTELLSSQQKFESPPKTDAGYRTVAVPPHILPCCRSTWTGTPGRSESSSGRTARRCAVTRCGKRSNEPAGRSAWKASASTTCGTPGKRSLRPLAPAWPTS